VELAKELDGLPLALATAGAYLDQVSTSFTDYLRLYKASWLRLQQTSPQISSYEDRQLYSTWQLSLDHIKQQNENSAKLLQLWAYFDNQDIWFELLQEGRSGGPEWLCQITEDELCFNQAVRVLCDHGLVEADRSSEGNTVELRGYAMHSCVHSWTIHVVNQEWNSKIAGLALECVGKHVPEPGAQNSWVTQRRLLRHADKSWGFIVDDALDVNGKEDILHMFGNMYSDQGKYNKAEQMYQRALQGKEKAWGLEHTSTLETVNNLGILYKDLGRLNKAETMYQRALQGFEKAWGLEHTSTLNTINNLGNLYKDLGRLDEAETMYQRALQGKEKACALEHTSTFNTINNLGNLYKDLGRLDEAETMYQRALQGFEKAWGPEHTSTLETVNSLGALYVDLGRLDEAETMCQRALQGKEKAWGLEHTSTLNTVNNLGILYVDLGRLDEAETMYQRALQGFEKAWGPEHTSTLDTVNNLAALYVDLGRLNEAETMCQRALQGKEKAWGLEHTSTLNTVNNLGNLYKDLGRLDEAETMYQRALQGYENALGKEAIKTFIPAVSTAYNLAGLFQMTRRGQEAEQLYLYTLSCVEALFGHSHKRYRDIVSALEVLRSSSQYNSTLYLTDATSSDPAPTLPPMEPRKGKGELDDTEHLSQKRINEEPSSSLAPDSS
jgi:tetratricopeptide (TPR) repeat protein